MRTITLVQFLSANHFDYGYEPELFQWYEVVELNSGFDYEDDDGYQEFISIYIRLPNGRCKDVLNEDNDLEYTTLTITVDDDSQLYVRR